MSDDLSQELRAFEGSEALANGDFSVCIRATDHIEAQAKRIAELEAHNPFEAVRFWRSEWDLTTDKKPAAVFEMPDRTGRPTVHQWPSLSRGERSQW